MKGKIAGYFNENKFKEGDEVVLRGERFKHINAKIKSLDEENKIAIVVRADNGETNRVDYEEMSPSGLPELQDLNMQSVEQEDEYRPVGVGTGKERDSFYAVGQALKKIEKELGDTRLPILAVKYESTVTDKWNIGLNCLWHGAIKFSVDFLDKTGNKHSGTVNVPIKNGLVQETKYISDNLNRRFELSAEGMKNFLSGTDWITEDPNKDEAVWTVPGQSEGFANKKRIGIEKKSGLDPKMIDLLHKQDLNKKAEGEEEYIVEVLINDKEDLGTNIFARSEEEAMDKVDELIRQENPEWENATIDVVSVRLANLNKKADKDIEELAEQFCNYNNKEMTKEAMYEKFAANPWSKIKKIIKDDEDLEKMRELLSLREIIDQEIKEQQEENEASGLDRNHGVNLKHRKHLNNMFHDVLDKYRGNIETYFNGDQKNSTIDRVMRNIKAKQDMGSDEPDEAMDEEKDKEEKEVYEKKKTRHKSPDKNAVEEAQKDSPVPSGTGNRENNDMSPNDRSETRFVH
jgi:hypothetical protein